MGRNVSNECLKLCLYRRVYCCLPRTFGFFFSQPLRALGLSLGHQLQDFSFPQLPLFFGNLLSFCLEQLSLLVQLRCAVGAKYFTCHLIKP